MKKILRIDSAHLRHSAYIDYPNGVHSPLIMNHKIALTFDFKSFPFLLVTILVIGNLVSI